MSDFSSNVTWQEILTETENGNIPHCRAIAAPSGFHSEIIETLSKLILGSYRPSHPDLLIIGSIDKPAPIDDARGLIENIALKPLEAEKRLGVVMSADKLNKSAANSLLKLSEEPPAHAYLLFLMEDGRFFLPTLKSRSRFSVIKIDDEKISYSMPNSESEWLEWFAKTRKESEIENILNDLEAWRNFAESNNNFFLAYKIDKLRIITDKKNLSVNFLCDMIILVLKGENKNIENIFNDIR